MELVFGVDTKHRKEWFTGISFSHPAKMSLPLQLWIIENYTKPGDTILDPMAGSGTVLVACSLGRNVIAVELEPKFVEIMKGNWEKIKQRGPQLGYSMGQAQIIQGDARKLENILADHTIFSPPYAGMKKGGEATEQEALRLAKAMEKSNPKYGKRDTPGRLLHLRKEQSGYSENLGNVGNLPYGDVDSIITSPPYAIEKTSGGLNTKPAKEGQQGGRDPNSPSQRGAREGYGETDGQIAQLVYGSIDSVITSPPYEASVSNNKESPLAGANEAKYGRWKNGTARKISYTQHGEPCKVDSVITSPPYEGAMDGGSRHTKGGIPQRDLKMKRLGSYDTTNPANIGNLYKESYLSAMLQVYEQCYRVLRPSGFMVLVTKNFIRDKKEVHLDADTIRLCEAAGFLFVERHYRKLPAQSFWRVIYRQRYPEAPVIDKEDILVFRRG